MIYFIQENDSGPIKIGFTDNNINLRLQARVFNYKIKKHDIKSADFKTDGYSLDSDQ